jgi:hypothetical protein
MALVHRELSWILRFEVEEACLPVDGRPEERVARTDRVAAVSRLDVGGGLGFTWSWSALDRRSYQFL